MEIKHNTLKVALEKAQGLAYEAALKLMQHMDNHVSVEVDDYIVHVVSEKAEGTYQLAGGGLKWHVPEATYNTHMEVVVQDKHDLRFIPELKIKANVLKDGQLVEERDFPFFWHPFLNHYGSNFHIEEAGEYEVEVHIPAPSFPRHDEVKGKRYVKDVIVKVGPLKLEKGRKPHGPE
ncbi:iron transporter [Pontibacter chitinilyticus]|uniref:iron transporter n=1 Tax=Pontibacter chitinilyticus TaxID=2674989 RepID=UPI00321B2BD1